jgi:hypothetical protein
LPVSNTFTAKFGVRVILLFTSALQQTSEKTKYFSQNAELHKQFLQRPQTVYDRLIPKQTSQKQGTDEPGSGTGAVR